MNQSSHRDLWTDAFLERKRQHMDPPADEAITAVFGPGVNPAEVGKVNRLLGTMTKNGQIPDGLPETLRSFLQKSAELPAWADRDLVHRGEILFQRNALEIMAALLGASLPECYTMKNGVQVLWQTQRLEEHTTRRLSETAKLILDVMAPNGLDPRGSGIVTAQRVRLMHASIRHLIRLERRAPAPASASQDSMQHVMARLEWNPAWGQPVNQEDLAFTLLTFSFVTLRALRSLGLEVDEEEERAYLHCWNVVGHLMGVDDDLLAWSYDDAEFLFEKIKSRQAGATQAGKELTAALAKFVTRRLDLPAAVSDHVLHTLIRFFVSAETAEMIGVPKSGLVERLIVDVAVEGLHLFRALEARSEVLDLIGFVVSRVFIEYLTQLRRFEKRSLFSLPVALGAGGVMQGVASTVSWLRELGKTKPPRKRARPSEPVISA